ncbi:hypothetical protein [Streptomyces sp. NPDC017964]|uniref:hypothetical protein n=1 Tax=Streptomyces sp. NPDC017964 TaxID=3365022 RepID=UPI0037B34B67
MGSSSCTGKRGIRWARSGRRPGYKKQRLQARCDSLAVPEGEKVTFDISQGQKDPGGEHRPRLTTRAIVKV